MQRVKPTIRDDGDTSFSRAQSYMLRSQSPCRHRRCPLVFATAYYATMFDAHRRSTTIAIDAHRTRRCTLRDARAPWMLSTPEVIAHPTISALIISAMPVFIHCHFTTSRLRPRLAINNLHWNRGMASCPPRHYLYDYDEMMMMREGKEICGIKPRQRC